MERKGIQQKKNQVDEEMVGSLEKVANFTHLVNYELREIISDLISAKSILIIEDSEHADIEVLVKISIRNYLAFSLFPELRETIFRGIKNIVFYKKQASCRILVKVKWLFFGWDFTI